MTTAATPWDALMLPGLRIRIGQRAEPVLTAPEGTKLAALLSTLAQRESATTATLSACCDLDTRQVWGLLKAPRERGQVRFEDGRWSLNNHYRGAGVQRAAELLRSHGWYVEPPEEAA